MTPFWAAALKGLMTYGTTQGRFPCTFQRFYVSSFFCPPPVWPSRPLGWPPRFSGWPLDPLVGLSDPLKPFGSPLRPGCLLRLCSWHIRHRSPLCGIIGHRPLQGYCSILSIDNFKNCNGAMGTADPIMLERLFLVLRVICYWGFSMKTHTE